MFCKNCGKEIDDKAFVCPHCGVLQKDDKNKELINQGPDGMSIAALVCAILATLVGLILSIISYNNHKMDPIDNPSRKMSKAALIVSIVLMSFWVVYMVIFIIIITLEALV